PGSTDFGKSFLTNSLQPAATAVSALDQLGTTRSGPQRAAVFPDTYDEEDEDEFMGGGASHGLTLLPTAQDSDDDDDDEVNSFIANNLHTHISSLQPNRPHAPNGSSFGQFADARVVCDPLTGHAVLRSNAELDFADSGEFQIDEELIAAPELDAVKEGVAVANYVMHRSVVEKAKEKAKLAAQSLTMFTPDEQYRAYQSAIDRQAQLDSDLAAGK
ncbi:hypothetical protein GGI06_002013, partial [Coemansia sp. S85]